MSAIEPQPGPQMKFLSSSADIAIYGGAAGGGKSWALLMEPLRHSDNPEFSAVIFRRNMTHVTNPGGLWDEATKLYSNLPGATPRLSNPMRWTFPSGSQVTFAHLETESTVLNWQGAQVPLLCCEENELIRMSDGSHKALKSIVPGDMVATLRGGRKVLFVGERRLESCVRATVSVDGNIRQQIQSTTHKVLTEYGDWISYGDKLNEFRQLSTCEPTVSYASGISPEQRQKKFPPVEQYPCNSREDQTLDCEPNSQYLDHLSSSVTGVDIDLQYQENCFEGSECELEIVQPPFVATFSVVLQEPDPVGPLESSFVAFCESPCARHELAPEDYWGHYFPCFHLCDAHAGLGAETSPVCALLPAYAVEQIQTDLLSDGLGKAQKCNFRKQRYVHPYRGTEQTAEVRTIVAPCQMVPCGNRWVIDLTISDQSHYITESGLVNKNCFDELTHFSKNQFFYLLSRNRSMCGVRPYVRATCNPDADSWVAEFIAWWISPETGLPIPERSGVIRYFIRVGDLIQWADNPEDLPVQLAPDGQAVKPKSVTFIAAKLTDNAALMAADPGYYANLMSLPTVDRERLLGGNWKIRPAAGLYFQRSWCEIVDVLPAGLQLVRYWDLAATPKTETNDPDWTVGVKMGRDSSGIFYLTHAVRLREAPSGVEAALINTASADGYGCRIGLPQDPGQAGKSQASYFVQKLSGYTVSTERETGDKVTRFGPFSSQAKAGNIKFLRGPWLDDVLTSLEGFPKAAHDDDADACSGSFAMIGLAPPPMNITAQDLQWASYR